MSLGCLQKSSLHLHDFNFSYYRVSELPFDIFRRSSTRGPTTQCQGELSGTETNPTKNFLRLRPPCGLTCRLRTTTGLEKRRLPATRTPDRTRRRAQAGDPLPPTIPPAPPSPRPHPGPTAPFRRRTALARGRLGRLLTAHPQGPPLGGKEQKREKTKREKRRKKKRKRGRSPAEAGHQRVCGRLFSWHDLRCILGRSWCPGGAKKIRAEQG